MTGKIKNTTLELTINPSYVRDWGIWEAVRELLQNAIDAHDRGAEMIVEYNKDAKVPTLKIENHGTCINRDAFLLGSTSKADDRQQRGQFGEGFKLAWLVLARNDRKVWCKSGDERWIPSIGRSASYGVELLKVDVAPVKFEDKISVVVQLKEEEWLRVKERILFLSRPDPSHVLDLGANKILLGPQYQGQLYSKGIWVCQMPNNYQYGYDLSHVQLDRDRCLADPWSLTTNINDAMNEALRQGKFTAEEAYDLVNSPYEEARVAANCASFSTSCTQLPKRVADHFLEKHGDNAAPVASVYESTEAKRYGLKAVEVTPQLKETIEQNVGGFHTRKEARARDVKKQYSVSELTEAEAYNLAWVCRLLHSNCKLLNIIVVDFVGDTVTGAASAAAAQINIARSTLMSRKDLLITMVRETTLYWTDDEDIDHDEAIHDSFARLVLDILNGDIH